MKLSRVPVAGAVLLAALALAACGNVANPEGWASPVYDEDQGHFLLLLDKDRVAAVTVEEGVANIEWEFPDDGFPGEEDIDIEAVYGEPVIDGDVVYLAGWEGEVYAIGREDGRLIWSTDGRTQFNGSIVSGPVLAGETLFVGTTEGFLYAINAADGSPSADWPEDGLSLSNKGIWARPIVADERLYVATMDGKLRALDSSTGDELWDEPFTGDSGAIPDLALVDDSTLFVPTLGKDVFLVNAETGKAIGEPVRAEDWIWTRPAVQDGVAYFGDFGGALVALDITSHEVLWRQQTNDRVKAGPAIVGDWVVFADESPAILFVNRETGEIRNRVPLADAGTIRASVTAQDGVAYALTTNGKLFRADPERFSAVQVPVSDGSQ